ncbi:solute carrier family 4 member 11-like isoform X2 [Mya arenaria]|uniref:solute carrier family 4 member 11-like isoform X2 n=1 Tax=Mya arenaria TaxID=6604 RepID=UPI0022E95EB6|nr:solute carrier family 4 member 11-like isoform X2 [Mya arenaria]
MDSPELETPMEGPNGTIPLLAPGKPEQHDVRVSAESSDAEQEMLIHAKHERLPMKDFGAEVRALRDVENFLDRTMLILNMAHVNLDKILQDMVAKVRDAAADEIVSTQEALDAIYSQQSVQVLSKTIHGVTSDDSGTTFDQSWLCALCELPTVYRRHVVIARLVRPANLGATSQDVRLVVLVVAPTKEKHTKTALETGRTFGTLLSDSEFRLGLHEADTEEDFRSLLHQRTKDLIKEQSVPENRKSHQQLNSDPFQDSEEEKGRCPLGRGMMQDVKRRLPHYWSDYLDGIRGPRTLQKVTATILFLYFACVLPNIAFGMLNDNNTNGVKKILFSQCFGGLVFALVGGQPLIVLLTTAPLALYTKIIYSVCEDFDLDFPAMFACVGLWNAAFLVLYSVTNLSKLMKFSTRSTEEIFSLFITFAFSADAIKDTIKDFNKNYYNPACASNAPATNLSLTNASVPVTDPAHECLRENSVLFLLLMLGTVWVGLTLFNFTKTPFLTAGKREMLADYALPAAVLIMSFFGSYVFRHVELAPFKYEADVELFRVAPLGRLPWPAVVAAAGLGFSLSFLFFMDQNISSALVNTPSNKLKKGPAYHWDLFTVALINGFLSVFTLPWVHAALPHSPLHVKALADLEDRVDQGHIHQVVVRVRETRLTGIVSHVMIGLSMLLLPRPLSYIPAPVLDGLFLYVALTALFGNQLFDRICLFFTEQSAYPPNHYIRRVPQRQVHAFTGFQLAQLLVLCVFGFSPIPYMKMVFPILLMCLMPIRHKLVTRLIAPRYLEALDGH